MVIATKDISFMDKVRIEIEENGEYKTVWSFAEYVKENSEKMKRIQRQYNKNRCRRGRTAKCFR